MMTAVRSSVAALLLVLISGTPASADATAIARQHSEAFGRACASGKLDRPAAAAELVTARPTAPASFPPASAGSAPPASRS